MKLQDYLHDIIGLQIEDNQELHSFLIAKDAELKDCILRLWDEFKTETEQCPEKESEAPVDHEFPELPSEEILLEGETPAEEETEQNEILIEEQEVQETDHHTSKTDSEMNENNINELFSSSLRQKHIVLPNGKVNQPYSAPFNLENFGITEISDYWIEGLEKIGLHLDKENQQISGTPILAGDHKIILYCKKTGWTEDKPAIDKDLSLIINPDPKSLWNNLPSDRNDPYWKDDFDLKFRKVDATGFLGKNERKDIVAASQRGRSHAHEGRFRDDDFGMNYDEKNEWYVIAVADGAGSAKYSRKGSQIACQTVIETCSGQLTTHHKGFTDLIKIYNKERSEENRKKLGDALYNIVGSAVFKAYKNIEKEAQESNSQIRDFGTTLIVSICRKFKFGWFVAAFWVGDGGIGIYTKEPPFLKILGEPDGGEFAGQTRFLTMSEIVQPAELYRRLRFDIVDDFTALILMTDGITDPKFETDANLSRIEKWDQLWEDLSSAVDFKDDNAESASQLLKWLDFWSPGNHDDRTIAILF